MNMTRREPTKREVMEQIQMAGRLFQGRRYETPPDYLVTEYTSATLASVIRAAMEGSVQVENPQIWQFCTVASRLLEHQCPIFWLDKDLLEALDHTDFPDSLNTMDLTFPHPATWFQLPLSFMKTPEGSNIASIVIAHYDRGYNVRHLHAGEGGILIMAFTDGLVRDIGDSIWRVHIPLRDRTLLDVVKTLPSDDSNNALINDSPAAPLNDDEIQFNQKLALLTIKIILFLMSRDRALPKSVVTRKEKRRGNKILQSEMWSPNFISNPVRRTSTGTSTSEGVSVRPHWVRGHFRRQHYGKGGSLTKTILVQAYQTGEGD